MNSITLMILRGVASGNVTLTSRVLGTLKEVRQEKRGGDAPENSAAESDNQTPALDKHLAFDNSLPRRWTRRIGCVMTCALILGAGLAHAELNPGKFETANDACAQGQYAEAARGYESIIAQQGWSAPVLFNLANAQQRNGQLGRAILNYERAALLAPGDPDIAANLHRARQKAGVVGEPESHFAGVARLMTLNGWFCFTAVALFLMAAALPLKQLRPEMRQGLNWGKVPVALVLAVAGMAIAIRWPDLNGAIITAPESVAGVSPVSMAQPMFKLHAGEVVKWKQTHGAFAYIENGAGQEGWVKTGEVARIFPTPVASSCGRTDPFKPNGGTGLDD